MGQRVLNVASVSEDNGVVTDPANIVGQYDVATATLAQDEAGNWTVDALLEDTTNTPTDINHFKFIHWNSGNPLGTDIFTLQFYDHDTTSWIDFSSSPMGPSETEYADGQYLTDILVKFDAAADKADWINAFAIRWYIQELKGADGAVISTQGVELEIEVLEFVQSAFRICTAPGDNADPDNTVVHTWADANVDVTGVVKEAPFFVRIGITVTGDDSANWPYTFYYNTVDDIDTATQIKTDSNVVRIVDDPESAIVNYAETSVSLLGFADVELGQYIDTVNLTEVNKIDQDHTVEMQVCVQFQADADDGTDYYFFVKRDGEVLDKYTEVPKIRTVGDGPKGPLGHPLHGPFRGPI